MRKIYGDAAPVPGDRQVPTMPVSKAGEPPLQVGRFARNTKSPDPSFFNQCNVQMTHALLFRTKECFSILGDLGSTPGIQATSTSGERKRFRFAFHTGPLHNQLLASVVMHPPSVGAGTSSNGYATLKIYDDAEETNLITTETFYYGAGPEGATAVGGWQFLRCIDRMVVGLDPDTTYFAVVADQDYGRIQSMAVADLQSVAGADGYLATNWTEESDIVDAGREALVSQMPALWKRGAAKVFNWTTNIQGSPKTNATSTLQNILDTSVTSVSAASPGWTLDMRYKTRLSQATAPCRLWVCGSWAPGGGATDGMDVSLKDSAGSVIASIDDGWNSTTPKWVSVDVNMPPLLDKVDIQFNNGGVGGTASIYAVCMYQYE